MRDCDVAEWHSTTWRTASDSSISGVKPTSAGAAQNGADDPFRTYPPVDTLTQ